MLKKGEEIRKLKLVGFAFLVTIIAIVLVVISWVPSLSLIGKEEITIKIGEKYSESGCSAIFMNQDVSDKVKIEGNVDENKVGEYDVKYTIKNLMGTDENILTRKIIVYDDIKPTIELVEDDVLVKVGEEYIEPGYNATDNYDGDITDRVVVQSNIDNTKDGEYEVTYLVKDSSSNSATAKRKVIVYEHNAESIPILSYHNFMTYEEKLKYAPYEKYTMSTEMFEQQLQYLKENGFNSITLDDFYLWYIGKKKLDDKDFVLAIDDGNISAYYYAIPLIEKYGFNATIFVITGRITEEETNWDPSLVRYFTTDIIDDINRNHKTIHLASHTHYLHAQVDGSCVLSTKNYDEIYDDVTKSKKILDSDYLAYPFGCYTDASIEALKNANYKMAFTFAASKRATRNDNIYAIERINVNSETTMQEFINWLEE